MHHPISIATPEEAKFIDNKIDEFINAQTAFTHEIVIKNYVIKENDLIIAGINSDIYYWGILYVEVLFVHDGYRGKGLGSQLLAQVEADAKEMGARMAHLDTFDFQAKDFYLKHGYEIFGTLKDFPEGQKRYYLSKRL
ncbi:MAG: N-acetyltransferase [Legionella sp.]|nr:MAG: N-acetyltransferase [Legionella sp.]